MNGARTAAASRVETPVVARRPRLRSRAAAMNGKNTPKATVTTP
jgi:hypothetical protein